MTRIRDVNLKKNGMKSFLYIEFAKIANIIYSSVG